MKEWKNRILGHGEESPEQLAANPRNWRIHPASQQAALKGALEEIGWIQDVIVNKRTGYVVDGHARVALAMRYDQKTVPVKYVDLTDEEEGIALATFDPIGALAATDSTLYEELLATITQVNDDLTKFLADETPVSYDVDEMYDRISGENGGDEMQLPKLSFGAGNGMKVQMTQQELMFLIAAREKWLNETGTDWGFVRALGSGDLFECWK